MCEAMMGGPTIMLALHKADVQVAWSEIKGTCFWTHPQQLAVAAAAAASHPELDDSKIVPESMVDLQVRTEPPRAAHPQPTSP